MSEAAKTALAIARAREEISARLFLAPEPRENDREDRWSNTLERLTARLDAIPADAPKRITELEDGLRELRRQAERRLWSGVALEEMIVKCADSLKIKGA